MASDEAASNKRDPLRLATWAISGFLATIGLFFGLYSGQPWPSKDRVQQLERDVATLEHADEMSLQERRTNTLAIQALRYELQQMRERHQWYENELEALKAYIYPAPNTRIPGPRPKAPPSAPPLVW